MAAIEVGRYASQILKSGTAKMATAGGLGFGADVGMNLYQGDSLGTSLVKASATGVIAASNPVLFGGFVGANLAKDAYFGVKEFSYKKNQWWNAQYAYNNQVGGNYADSQRAITMRQAAIQSIQGSKMNARSALGGEAKIMNPYATRRY